MRKTLLLLVIVFTAFDAFAAGHKQKIAAFTNITIPVMANSPGLQGAFFKTRVAILNPTQLSYPIEVTLYDNTGEVATANINMAAGQIRNYENFLQQVFSFGGAGAVKFDSLSGSGQDFIVTSEVYTESSSGSYKTVVSAGPLLENALPDFDNFSLGIRVDPNSRANVGVFNDSSGANQINADVFDSSGTLLTTITFNQNAKTWTQFAVPVNVSGGYIKWRVQSSAYCYAVVVDNTSNDGTFIPASDYIP